MLTGLSPVKIKKRGRGGELQITPLPLTSIITPNQSLQRSLTLIRRLHSRQDVTEACNKKFEQHSIITLVTLDALTYASSNFGASFMLSKLKLSCFRPRLEQSFILFLKSSAVLHISMN